MVAIALVRHNVTSSMGLRHDRKRESQRERRS
jgi:hypothetical protein